MDNYKDKNRNIVINVPKSNASESAARCEAQLERAYCLKNRSFYTALDHQLPARIFNKSEIKKENAITPGGFIDIWGIKNNTLKIFELKLPTNTEIGIISELMFYVNVMSDVLQHEINIPQKSEFRSFDKLYELYENKGTCKQIEGVFLAEKFHPLIQEKQEEVLQIINSGKFPEDTPVFFSFDKPDVEIFYHQSDKVGKPKKLKTYKEQQKDRQLKLLYQPNGIFEGAHGCGYFKNNMYPYVLLPKDSDKNLFAGIRGEDECTKYFENEHISWWGEGKSKPTGHLLSSQIHCLNHLFALRNDKDVVLAILNHVTEMGFDEVLPSSLDRDGGYIAFEFAYKNNEILGETDKGARRGVLCTSIDAMIVARKGGEKWLIPIEWKYTESYEKEDKTNDTRLNRYGAGIIESRRLKTPKNGIAHSIYFQEPSYELMRQTILTEGLINRGLANNMFHLVVIPERNKVLRDAVEKEFVPMLEPNSKFCIIDPQSLLSPLESNAKYKDLITYLKTRYW